MPPSFATLRKALFPNGPQAAVYLYLRFYKNFTVEKRKRAEVANASKWRRYRWQREYRADTLFPPLRRKIINYSCSVPITSF
jgi:hypothetical protein